MKWNERRKLKNMYSELIECRVTMRKVKSKEVDLQMSISVQLELMKELYGEDCKDMLRK